jgi:signal transduction histidine kinase
MPSARSESRFVDRVHAASRKFHMKPTTLIALVMGLLIAAQWCAFIAIAPMQRRAALDEAGNRIDAIAAAAAFHAAALIRAGQPLDMGPQKIAGWARVQGSKVEEFPSFLRSLRPGPETKVFLRELTAGESHAASSVIAKGVLPPAYQIDGPDIMSHVISLDTRIQAVVRQPKAAALERWSGITSNITATLLFFTLIIVTLSLLLIRQLHKREVYERALVQAKEQADAGNRAKSEFLANMSHELRTPLNAIIGFAEIMKEETLGPIGSTRYRSYAGDIFQSGTHLLSLINDVLDMSKYDSGHLELQEEDVDVVALTDLCIGLMETQAQKAKVVLIKDVDSGLPPLWADSRRLRQILFNLLSNAVKFTPEGGEVRVSARVAASGFVVRITDNGIGMAPDDLPAALEPFRQVDSTMSRKHTGTGLGLPLAKHLAEMHGAIFAIETAPDIGTSVTMTFPLSRVGRRTESAAAIAAA